MFTTLRAEMARYGIKYLSISESLGVTPKTLRSKISGEYPFTSVEMKKIRDEFFPSMTIDALFYEDNIVQVK